MNQDATETQRVRARRLPLAIRIFLLLAVLLSVAMWTAVLVSHRQGGKIAEVAVQRTLAASTALQAEFSQRLLGDVELKIQLIAADAGFVKYISDAQGDRLGYSGADAGSIQDLLLERQVAFGFDLGMVLDPDGEVLARTDQVEALQENLAEDMFVASALDPPAPISGYWRMHNSLYLAAIWPLAQDNLLIGFLIVANRVDDALAERVARVGEADVAYLLPVGPRLAIIGSSLDDAAKSALGTRFAEGIDEAVRAAQPLDLLELELGEGRWAGRLQPLDAEGGGRIGAVMQLTSIDQASAGYRAILNTVAVTGALTLLIALPLSLLLAKVSLRPLTDMARAAKAAASGDYGAHRAIEGRDELAELSQAFDRLLADLRSERDIEAYVSHLSRLMPDPGEEALEPDPNTTPDLPASRGELLLLAIERRQSALGVDGADADAVLAELEQWRAALQQRAQREDGLCVGASGERVLFAFEAEAAACALRVLQAAWAQTPLAAAALDRGEAVVGGLGDGALPVALGPVVRRLEATLAGVEGGDAAIAAALRSQVASVLGAAPVPVLVAEMLTGLAPAASEGDAEVGATVRSGGGAATVVSAPGATGAPTRPSDAPIRGPDSDLRPGTRLGDRYQILSVLGSGGMGVVYRARDLELDDVVALKMLRAAALVDREQLERLKSEIKLARKITHPNVLRTFDFGEYQGLPYISMEYVRGMTLRYLIKQAGRVPYTAALRIARQLCAGLGAAHAVGVLHRDIKPENLILEASGNAKLMDFGIARPIRRAESGVTEAGTYVGTPHYSAPEQLAGREVDHRADIYACGVLMNEMFCGHLPYQGNTTVELYVAQMEGEPEPPSKHWPEIPPALEALILRCIARRPEDRFADVAALAAELERLHT